MKKFLALPLLALGIASCDVSTAPPEPTINLTGVWLVERSPVETRWKLTMDQPLAALQGDVEAVDALGTPDDLPSPVGNVHGEVAGTSYTLTVTPPGTDGGEITLRGTTVGGKMTGTWSGTDAQGEPTRGRFTGTPQAK